jgi:hypothetical protein
MSNLSRFLVEIATDGAFKQRFAEDPQGAFDQFALTTKERDAYLSGDSGQLRVALGKPDNDCRVR